MLERHLARCADERRHLVATFERLRDQLLSRAAGPTENQEPHEATDSSRSGVKRSPSARSTSILIVEPPLDRREVLEDCCGVHGALAGDSFPPLRRPPALSHLQHACQALSPSLA